MKKAGLVATLTTAAGLASPTLAEPNNAIAANRAALKPVTEATTAEIMNWAATNCETKLHSTICYSGVYSSNQNLTLNFMADLRADGRDNLAKAVADVCPTDIFDWDGGPTDVARAIDLAAQIAEDCSYFMQLVQDQTGVKYNENQFRLMANYPAAVKYEQTGENFAGAYGQVQAFIFEHK